MPPIRLALPLLTLFALSRPVAAAETAAVSATEARTVCEAWIHLSWSEGSAAPLSILRVDPLYSLQGSDQNREIARVFQLSPEGWIVVPTDREALPVLAYSEAGRLDASSSEGMTALVRTRLEQSHSVGVDGRTRRAAFLESAWRELTARPLASADSGQTEEGGPLLESAWHQGEPFQDLCPMGTMGRSVVGCVATAGAQIMRYYQWPPAGVGSKSYGWDGDQSCGRTPEAMELTADFSDPYDWAHMPLTTGENEAPEVRSAVAELCYEVGVAVDMDYGTCASNSNPEGLAGALVQYFRYNSAIQTVPRLAYSRQAWFELIKEEIDAGRPLFYNITIHSLVCDGYRRDGSLLEYHVNYGWGGSNNAWFPLDEVPGAADQWVEFMVRRIVPAGRVHRVSADGRGAFATVQAALEGALSEETIELEDGVYSGEGNRDLVFPDRPLVLRSVNGDASKCVFDARGTRDDPHVVIAQLPVSSPGLTVEGITLRGAYDTRPNSRGAVDCSGGQVRFVDCVFDHNRAGATGGAVYISESRPAFEHCTFVGNYPYGVECFQAAPTFLGCTFTGHDLSSMRVHESDVSLEHCSFVLNRAREGDLHVHSLANLRAQSCLFAFSGGQAINAKLGRVTLECCDVWGNAAGDFAGGIFGQDGVNGNFRADPLLCTGSEDETMFAVQENSPCVTEGECGLIGAWGIGCRRPTTAVEGDLAAERFLVGPIPTRGPLHLRFTLPRAGVTQLAIFDAAGRRRRELVHGEMSAGRAQIDWDGRDEAGRTLPSGTYFARLVAPGLTLSERVILLR
ncbi:MAG: C10 family peptidase [Candidatus Eisenbacteria bacterium]